MHIESVGELSSYDNHPADEASELFERQKDVALNEHEGEYLKSIHNALLAIEKGTYGKCVICGKDIPYERLEAIPTTIYCKEHSPDKVTSKDRPVEEDVLMTPYGKFNFDVSRDEGITLMLKIHGRKWRLGEQVIHPKIIWNKSNITMM